MSTASGEKAVALSARSLVYSYGAAPAVKGVSLEVARGEILSITGASGSGKSTLLLCLAGVLAPDAGEVRLGDRIISAESESERSRLRRSQVGVVFQFGQLVPELTALENVALPLLLGGARRSAAETAARTWLERFEVGGLADARPPGMSGGQSQRVAIARAMVTEPEVVLADEPTGALDSLSGELVMNQLVRVVREAGTTVVLVTHDARVSAYGDREIHLRDGELDPHPADLLDAGVS
ncbi:ABC transporter ATP-binding protein [Luteipulveratus sp. YIM 133132]|uniref:ABC transporter ATP-binding protein n=1 Tax=Luteipulveratus flavus TaxID=3031728 RepID=A0ABT6CC28_9MICO|nr:MULTISPECIES: ABC transporter ATP-binding protein [unclassified Luteipulveratus]MDE9366606.1 ABC transporter ATP-binding protein [Luteipulveratus sp. YIM 133132]MDF8266053.1 ABC transporter ATP-binding protein [Luteipulveratus sp. YIM 133296]